MKSYNWESKKAFELETIYTAEYDTKTSMVMRRVAKGVNKFGLFLVEKSPGKDTIKTSVYFECNSVQQAKKVAIYLTILYKEEQAIFEDNCEIIKNRLGPGVSIVKTGSYYSVHQEVPVGNGLYFTKWLGRLEDVMKVYNGQ